jgi:ABC-type dipeptide/oligopeptide/nickel transport system permease component
VLFVVRRLAMLPAVLLGVALVVFIVMHLAPGDPVLVMLGPDASPDAIEALRRDLRLDQPLLVQFGGWLSRAVRGDLGYSIRLKRPVAAEVMQKLRATIVLAAAGLGLATVVGLGLGVLSAAFRRSLFDRLTMVAVVLGSSMPIFWVGILLMVGVSLRLGWLPAMGMYSPAGPGTWRDLAAHLVLPAVTLALPSVAVIARLTRASVLEILSEDYIRAARAKGVGEARLLAWHALRNALIPLVTLVGVQTGYLLGGAILTETVFAWPGLGTLVVRGVLSRDFPLVQGCVLAVATTFVLVNVMVDVLYAWLDPRIARG